MGVPGSSSEWAGQTGCQQIAQLVQQPPYCSHQWCTRSLFPECSMVYKARRQTKLHIRYIWPGPLLIWLEKRLRGIPLYTMDMFNGPTTNETCKVEAYVDDVKPAFTSLAEFELIH